MKDTHGVMAIFVGNLHSTQVQILDKAICISNSNNTLGKVMTPNIIPLTMGK